MPGERRHPDAAAQSVVSGSIVVDHGDVAGLPGGPLAAVAAGQAVDGRIRNVRFC